MSLPALLKRLRDHGVSEAAFHPDGRLAAVTFAGASPPAETADDKPASEPPHITQARRAFQVLSGTRDEMESDGVVRRRPKRQA